MPIIKILISNRNPQGIADEKLNETANEFANKLINNPNTRAGFAMVGTNMEARKMYMSLCVKALMDKQSLTVTGCNNLANYTLATFSKS